jgi:hypothetical protein
MPATTQELSNKNDFRGDILDRDFPVHYDASTGTYSFDYAEYPEEVRADLQAKLQAAIDQIKYYRISSPTLSELETKLASHMKKVAPVAPRAKGEITKAAEEEAAKAKALEEAYAPIAEKEASLGEGEELSNTEKNAKAKLENESWKQMRRKRVEYAKQRLESVYNIYNERVKRAGEAGEELEINETTKRPKIRGDEQRVIKKYENIIDASDKLNSYNAKEKRGETLSAEEQADRADKIALINRFASEEEIAENTKRLNINSKGNYNSARATLTQLKNIPNEKLTTQQVANKQKARVVVERYEATHPNERRNEQKSLVDIELKRKQLKELNAKNKPLSEANAAKQAELEAEVRAFNAAHPGMNTNLMQPDVKNIFNNPATNFANNKPRAKEFFTSETREFNQSALDKRKEKAQYILDYFSAAGTPANTPEKAALQRLAKEVVNAYAKTTTKNVKQNEKNAAIATIRTSKFLNKAQELGVPTERATGGGKRRTRKAKKSKRKTHKRKQ